MDRPAAVIRWGEAARVAVVGRTADELRRMADRWCGVAEAATEPAIAGMLQLWVPPLPPAATDAAGDRVRLGFRRGGGAVIELRVNRHAVVAGIDSGPDVIRAAPGRPPTRLELELLVDLGVNHLLARQGLPVLHGCGFELGGVGVLGVGDSFSGKTTVAVAAMAAGGRVVSDDQVLVVPEGGRSALLPVRSYGWLRGRTREIVPGELEGRLLGNEEKGRPRWVLGREDAGGLFVGRSVPRAIWVQSVDRRLGASRIEPVDQGRVFAALIRASSPIYLSRHCPEIRDRLIPVFRSLCGQCRGFRVRLGRRLLDDPAAEIGRLVAASRQSGA